MSSNISGACCKGETGYDLEDSTVPKPQSHTGAISETGKCHVIVCFPSANSPCTTSE